MHLCVYTLAGYVYNVEKYMGRYLHIGWSFMHGFCSGTFWIRLYEIYMVTNSKPISWLIKMRLGYMSSLYVVSSILGT